MTYSTCRKLRLYLFTILKSELFLTSSCSLILSLKFSQVGLSTCTKSRVTNQTFSCNLLSKNCANS